MVETMRQFTEDMTYEWLEDEDCFISRESMVDGTVRVIEGELYYSEKGSIEREQEFHDVRTNIFTKEEKVTFWRLVDHL